jgi:hypothetical protein
MKLFLTSSPIGIYRSEEPLNYSGFNPANGMVDALRKYWREDSRCLLVSAFPDEYDLNDRMRADYKRFIPGLGLTEYNILPHYNAVKNDILDGMRLIEDITFADSYGHTFYAITDGSYILQTEEGAEICGEAYMIHDGKIEQVCSILK